MTPKMVYRSLWNVLKFILLLPIAAAPYFARYCVEFGRLRLPVEAISRTALADPLLNLSFAFLVLLIPAATWAFLERRGGGDPGRGFCLGLIGGGLVAAALLCRCAVGFPVFGTRDGAAKMGNMDPDRAWAFLQYTEMEVVHLSVHGWDIIAFVVALSAGIAVMLFSTRRRPTLGLGLFVLLFWFWLTPFAQRTLLACARNALKEAYARSFASAKVIEIYTQNQRLLTIPRGHPAREQMVSDIREAVVCRHGTEMVLPSRWSLILRDEAGHPKEAKLSILTLKLPFVPSGGFTRGDVICVGPGAQLLQKLKPYRKYGPGDTILRHGPGSTSEMVPRPESLWGQLFTTTFFKDANADPKHAYKVLKHVPKEALRNLVSTVAGNFRLERDQPFPEWWLRQLGAGPRLARSILSVAFSPDGRTAVTGGEREEKGERVGEVLLWDVRTGVNTHTLIGHTERVEAVAFSPDAKTVATGSSDGTIELWDARARLVSWTVIGHAEGVTSIAFAGDGKLLASGSMDGTVKLWDLHTGKLLRELISESGKGGPTWAASSSDGRTVVGVKLQTQMVGRWNVHTGEFEDVPIQGIPLGESIAFSSDLKTAIGGATDGKVRVWYLYTGKLRRTLTGHSSQVMSVAVSPDGETVASSALDRIVKLWDVSTGKMLRELTGHRDRVTSLAFSPDGKTLASGSDDYTVKLWNIPSGQLKRTLKGEASRRSVLHMHLDQAFLALCAGKDRKAVLEIKEALEMDSQSQWVHERVKRFIGQRLISPEVVERELGFRVK